MIIGCGSQRSRSSSAPKAGKGKSDSGSSRKGPAAGASRQRDVVLLSPCRGAVRTKVHGKLKRQRDFAPLRLTAKVIKHLTQLATPLLACLIPEDVFNPTLSAATLAPMPTTNRAPSFLTMGM